MAAISATAPRLGTVSFPEHRAKTYGAMRQAVFSAFDVFLTKVAEVPFELLDPVAKAYEEEKPLIIWGQQSIYWLLC